MAIDTLFDEMVKEDAEYVKLKQLPGFTDLIERYRESFDKSTGDFIEKMLVTHGEKMEEIHLFHGALDLIKQGNEKASIDMIEEFTREKKQVFRTFNNEKGEIADPMPVSTLQAKLEALSDKLMDLETQQVSFQCVQMELKYMPTKYIDRPNKFHQQLKSLRVLFLNTPRRILSRIQTSFMALKNLNEIIGRICTPL